MAASLAESLLRQADDAAASTGASAALFRTTLRSLFRFAGFATGLARRGLSAGLLTDALLG